MSLLQTDPNSNYIIREPLSNVDSNYSDANQFNDYSGNFNERSV
jgi:hypothetical protein